MTQQEIKMLAHMNKYSTTGRLVDTEELYDDIYRKHDAENDIVICEFKYRLKHYSTLMLERPKYDYMMDLYSNTGKIPLYVNRTPKGLYIFDLRKLKDIEWKTDRRNPATTAFANNSKVDKTYTDINITEAYKDVRWCEIY